MAYGITGLMIAILLTISLLWNPWDTKQSNAELVAHNFVILRNAVHEAIKISAKHAQSMENNQIWIEGTQCKTPLQATKCSVAVDNPLVTAYTPDFWQTLQNPTSSTTSKIASAGGASSHSFDGASAGTSSASSLTSSSRWKIHVANSRSYVYGTVTPLEMTEILKLLQHSPDTALVAFCKPVNTNTPTSSSSTKSSNLPSLNAGATVLKCSPELKVNVVTTGIAGYTGEDNLILPLNNTEINTVNNTQGIMVSVDAL